MDVTANLVTAAQLSAYMDTLNAQGATTATGTAANQDQWCYCLAAIVGTPCPAYDIGNGPTVLTDAQTFLDGLRNYQLSMNAATQQPGGATLNGTATSPVATVPIPVTVSAAPVAVTPTGVGLLGPTNCQFCQWLATPTGLIFLGLAAVGGYFAFFYKK